MIVGRVREGRVYRRVKERMVRTEEGDRVRETVRLHEYRVLGFAESMCTRRYEVVFVGAGGPDGGRMFVCSRAEFVLNFVDESPPEKEPEPMPEVMPPEGLSRRELLAAGWRAVKETSATRESVVEAWYPPEGGANAYSLQGAVQEMRLRAAGEGAT